MTGLMAGVIPVEVMSTLSGSAFLGASRVLGGNLLEVFIKVAPRFFLFFLFVYILDLIWAWAFGLPKVILKRVEPFRWAKNGFGLFGESDMARYYRLAGKLASKQLMSYPDDIQSYVFNSKPRYKKFDEWVWVRNPFRGHDQSAQQLPLFNTRKLENVLKDDPITREYKILRYFNSQFSRNKKEDFKRTMARLSKKFK